MTAEIIPHPALRPAEDGQFWLPGAWAWPRQHNFHDGDRLYLGWFSVVQGCPIMAPGSPAWRRAMMFEQAGIAQVKAPKPSPP